MGKICEYNKFKDIGKDALEPTGWEKIQVNLVHDIKNDGFHNARLVAGR